MRVFSRTALALGVGVLLGLAVTQTGPVLAGRSAPDADRALTPEEMRRLTDLLQRVRHEYVETVDERSLVEHALHGLVSGLDEYSEYLDARQYAEMRTQTKGHYTGIGVELLATQAGLEVLRPLEDSPAARAGIRRGDLIVSIDGRPVAPDAEAAIERMRGPSGSRVQLGVRRAEPLRTLEFSVQRQDVDVRSATASLLEPGYGYLRLSTFNELTASEVSQQLDGLRRNNAAPLDGLVIDLRNNPGGVLESAVAVADLFLDEGLIVSARGRTRESRFSLDATPGDRLRGAPIAVLVNGGSASASEILAGALKDHGRALVVGRRTYGKGSVQTVIPLAEGRALKLTTSHYATPSGARIDGRGIEPQVALPGADALHAEPQQDAEVRAALEALRQPRVATAERRLARR